MAMWNVLALFKLNWDRSCLHVVNYKQIYLACNVKVGEWVGRL